MLSVLFDGQVWSQQLGRIGDVEAAWLYSQTGGGLHSLKFSLALPKHFYDRSIREGVKVELFAGSVKLGSAILSEPDRENWTFAADGLYRNAETTQAKNDIGETVTNISDAIDWGNLRDLGWNGDGSIASEGLIYQKVEDQGEQATIADLFNAECKLTGKYWGLDANDVPYLELPPSTPTVAIAPGVPLMPQTDGTSVKRVTIRRLTGGTAAAPTAWEDIVIDDPDPDAVGREVFIDVAELGIAGGTSAADWAQDYFDAMKSRIMFTDDLQVVPGELTNTGSVPLSFWAAPLQVLGKRVLHHGVLDKKRGSDGKTVQWTCGSVAYRDGVGGGSLTIAPIDFAPRRLPDVIARMNDFYSQFATPHNLIDIYGMGIVGQP